MLFDVLVSIDTVFHAIAIAFYDHWFAMMDQAVEDGGCECCIIVEDGTPRA